MGRYGLRGFPALHARMQVIGMVTTAFFAKTVNMFLCFPAVP